MAENKVRTAFEKELSCPLCMDIFTEPKRLPCDHVYCKACLVKLDEHTHETATISCPECRLHIKFPNDSADNLPTDFRVNRFIEVYRMIKSNEGLRPRCDTVDQETCQDHPSQPLAIYCKTCKKQLCRDCLLKTSHHEGHDHGFFVDVAPEYRENLLSKHLEISKSSVKVSDSLKKLASINRNTKRRAEKCQLDIDRAFEQLIMVLSELKESLKGEAATYYQSVIRRFEHEERELQEFQKKLSNLSTSIDSALVDSDEKFMYQLDTLRKQAGDLTKKIPSLPLSVVEPQPLAVQIVVKNSLRKWLRSQCYLTKVANPSMCTTEVSSLENIEIGQQAELDLTLADSDGNMCQTGEDVVEVELIDHQGTLTKANITQLSPSHSKITFDVNKRGEHKLSIRVNGRHIKDSPFTFMVDIPPTLYSEPVATINELKQPVGLTCNHGIVVASEIKRNRIVQIDSQRRIREWYHLVGVNKLTQDSECNTYVTTVGDHRLHKIFKGQKSVKTVGKLGKGEAEFNYPNGLRISSKDELYVCDSNNRRVQVFDLDLKYKRNITQAKFEFPSDVDFDSSGRIYVVDFRHHFIDVFTSDERHTSVIANGIFNTFVLHNPISIVVHNGHIFVANYGAHNVIVLDLLGKCVATIGQNCLRQPESITIDNNGFLYVTSHNSKIYVF